VAWAADTQTIFYTQEEEVTKRSEPALSPRIWRESPAIPTSRTASGTAL
jgi:hypothetical protein